MILLKASTVKEKEKEKEKDTEKEKDNATTEAVAVDVSDVADAAQAAALSTLEDAMFGPLLIADVKGHKHECGKHVRPEETPQISARLQQYHTEHRRYPTPMPTAEQLAPEYKPTGRFLLFPGGAGRWVEDDEVLENPFAGGGGGGGAPPGPGGGGGGDPRTKPQ